MLVISAVQDITPWAACAGEKIMSSIVCHKQRESHYQTLLHQAAWKTASANYIMPLDVPSSAMAGPRHWRSDREEAGSPPSHPPSQHGKAQESCCVGKKPPSLISWERAVLPWSDIWRTELWSWIRGSPARQQDVVQSFGEHLERETGEISHLFSLCRCHVPVPQPALVLFAEIVHPNLDRSLCITTGNYLQDRKTL